jgi:nucleoid-associated protein YgaU
VRPWVIYGDSLWNIAGRAWAFNDPWQWRRLYEANRDRMPQPGNPDLIHPGMILDIPSIRGEVRQGMWQPGVVYPALP